MENEEYPSDETSMEYTDVSSPYYTLTYCLKEGGENYCEEASEGVLNSCHKVSNTEMCSVTGQSRYMTEANCDGVCVPNDHECHEDKDCKLLGNEFSGTLAVDCNYETNLCEYERVIFDYQLM